jgi:hypothetical protein
MIWKLALEGEGRTRDRSIVKPRAKDALHLISTVSMHIFLKIHLNKRPHNLRAPHHQQRLEHHPDRPVLLAQTRNTTRRRPRTLQARRSRPRLARSRQPHRGIIARRRRRRRRRRARVGRYAHGAEQHAAGAHGCGYRYIIHFCATDAHPRANRVALAVEEARAGCDGALA